MIGRRIAALGCAFALCVALTACHAETEDPVHTGSSVSAEPVGTAAAVTLPFSAKDVLNPYTAKTKQNQELSRLLYDPLIQVNESFEPELFLAASAEQTGKTIRIRLTKASFTDGSPVTADDVIYSLKQACAEGSNYRSKLTNLVNCYAADSTTVILEIGHGDPFYVNNLDFPIIKAGTAALKNDNNLAVAPIGCGRYTLQYDKHYCLTANPNYYRSKVSLSTIELVDCPDSDSLSHYLSIGKISMVYSDLSDSVIPKLAGTAVNAPSTSLVYLGVNSANALLADAKLRLAISFGIERDTICQEAYFGYAQAATSLFHPMWAELGGLESIDSTKNTEIAVAYLEKLGYNKLDSDGYRVREDGNRLTLRLLYNSDNSARTAAAIQIAAQLKKCGLMIEPVGADFQQYQSRLESGDFDLYLGEVRLSNSMDFYPVFSSRSVIYGMPEESEAAAAVLSFCAGETDLLSAVSAFVSEMPFLPLCYRDGVVLAKTEIAGVLSYSPSDPYNNLESLK